MSTALKLVTNGTLGPFSKFFHDAGPVDAVLALTGRAEVAGLRHRPLWSAEHATNIAAHIVCANNLDFVNCSIPAKTLLGQTY